MFPHFSSLTIWEWAILGAVLALLLFGLIWSLKRAWNKFAVRASGELSRKATAILATLPGAINADQQHKLHSYSEHLRELRAKRAAEEWTLIGIRIRGILVRDMQEGDEAYAPVLINWKTGELKPAPEDKRGFTKESIARGGYWGLRCGGGPKTKLSCDYDRVAKQPDRILLLGVEYHYV